MKIFQDFRAQQIDRKKNRSFSSNKEDILNLLEELHTQISLVQIVLRDAEVPSCYLVAAMIKNVHNDNRGDCFACPGVVAPCLSQTVTGNFARNIDGNHCRMDDSPCLYTGNRTVILPIIRENVLPTAVWEV